MTDILVYCDRCKAQVQGAFRTNTATAGFYDVTPGLHGTNQWTQYAREGERNVCDECMWSDPRYIVEHGHQVRRS